MRTQPLSLALTIVLLCPLASAQWWEQYSGTDKFLYWVAAADANTGTAVGESGTILRTTNEGASWTLQSSGKWPFLNGASFTDANTGTAVGDYGTILRTTNGGLSWNRQASGTTVDLYGVSLSSARAGVAVGRNGTILRTVNGGGTWVEGDRQRDIPQNYLLSQNYPNPFNPSTTIKYELPKSSEVRLSVFDMLGRGVTVLVNDRMEAGTHEVSFDGSNLSSGVYFYQLRAGDFVQTKRLALLK